MKNSLCAVLIAGILFITSPLFAAEKREWVLGADTAYTANERTKGTISTDRNLESIVTAAYHWGDGSQVQVNGKFGLLQILSDEAQNHELGFRYLSATVGPGKLNTELAVHPFSDLTKTANTNTESRLALNYLLPLDKNSNLNLKGNYKIQAWPNSSTQDYNVKQMGLNFQRQLGLTQNLGMDFDYTAQDANTAASSFSGFQLGANFSSAPAKDKKLGIRYSLDRRGYAANSSSTYLKSDLNLNLGLGPADLGFNLVSYNLPDSPASAYSGFGFTYGITPLKSEIAKWVLKSGLLFRDSTSQTNTYAKINLNSSYDLSLSASQSIRISDQLENSIYQINTSNYLHNLFGIKYETRFSDTTALSLGERFTLDNYPAMPTQNAARHQIDINYSWSVIKDLSLFFNGGYEIKSFSSPSASQSDYNSSSLSVSLDHKFSPEGKTSLAASSFTKINQQNASADTRNTNLSVRVAYDF